MDIPIHPPPPGYSYSHSVPHSPYAYDHHPPPPPHHDIESAFRHAHSSLPRGYYDVPGYPPGARPRSPRARSHSPFPPGFPPMNYEPDGYGGPERQYSSHQSTEENVRRYEYVAASKGSAEKIDRTNLAVQLVNGQISPSAKCAQLQPKMMREGRFPSDFRTPRTADDMQAMECRFLPLHTRIIGVTLYSIHYRAHPPSLLAPNRSSIL